MSSANDLTTVKAAFQAAGICVSDPTSEISFKEGCIRMGFYHRQNFKAALKRQQHIEALGASIDGARLPELHWKGDSQWFYLHEVEAYIAATQSE
jgi:hypothetical protein